MLFKKNFNIIHTNAQQATSCTVVCYCLVKRSVLYTILYIIPLNEII